jgi:ribosomal protein S18 acetylase RimI-like enzyme
MTMRDFDDDWLIRIEDAGINASAPREQRWLDGWLVRLAPGKAKRARSIQPVAPGRLGVDEKLAQCLPLFAAAGLPPIVRITPFAQPARLDEHLAALGMERFDDSLVMVLPALANIAAGGSTTATADKAAAFESIDARAFAAWVGAARGSSEREISTHADRIANAPLPHHAVVVRDQNGAVVCGGQVVVDGSLAGLYDIFTLAEARGRGLAERLCRHLLGHARRLGADAGYLQVDAGNDGARRLYRRMGFRDAYPYHYRTPAAAAD